MTISYSTIAPKNGNIVIDRTRSADPIEYTFWLQIHNQGTTTMYYKITTADPNWSITSPTNGELGAVDSGATVVKKIQIQRTLPTSDTVETPQFTVEAYSDSGYTNLIESTNFSIEFVMADIHSFPSYTKYGFDDGTEQGWTLNSTSGNVTVSISSDKSITAGGYCVKIESTDNNVYATITLSKSETLPANSRVAMVFFFNMYYRGSYSVKSPKISYIKVKVDGTVVFETSSMNLVTTTTWDMIGVDLSDYAGQTVTIEIEIYLYSIDDNDKVYIDDIILAGTDAL